MAQAASALARWHRDRPGLGLSINLSVAQLKEDDRFIDFVRATLAREGLPPASIEFEVTESIFLDPALPVVDRRLRELVAMGIGLAIDDFGTGYSSLGYLRRFPFAAIKIDRSFVREISSDNGRAIVEAIVGLGLNLKKRLVAEGWRPARSWSWCSIRGATRRKATCWAGPSPRTPCPPCSRPDGAIAASAYNLS